MEPESRPGEFLPLRGLARALIILLLATIALTAAALAFSHRLAIASAISMTVTSILFLVWFRRARINAERSGWRQRRARVWAFWGWVIPIGNIWIPFQIMGDIWRAGLPTDERGRTAWLPVLWWASWLLATPPVRLHNSHTSAGVGPASVSIGLPLPDGWFSFVFFAIAGLTLAAIVGAISDGPVGRPNPAA